MINFRCNQCNQKLSISEVHTGTKVKCSSCKNTIVVPQVKKIQINKSVKEKESAPDIQLSVKSVESNLSELEQCPIHFKCTSCEYELKAPDAMRGKIVICPQCQCYVPVPITLSNCEESGGADSSVLREPTKDCPFCGEEVLERAKKCKHCGEFIANDAAETSRSMHGVNAIPPTSYIDARTPENKQLDVGWVILGWFMVFFLPIIGLIFGIVCCTKKRTGNGTAMIILSLLSMTTVFLIGWILLGLGEILLAG